MRHGFQPQLRIGQTPIGEIGIDVKSRDDIPSILHGLQRLYMEASVLEEVIPDPAIVSRKTPSKAIHFREFEPGTT